MKALLLLACFGCATAHATTTSEVRAVGSFHALAIEAAADVELTIGSTTRVEVNAPKDWLGKLQTRVENGVLHVTTAGVHGRVPRFKLTITTPSLDAIAVSGATSLHATKLHAGDFAIQVSGAATLDLAGTVDQLAVAISGEAQLEAKDLIAQTAAVNVDGACNGTLHASRSLAAAISGTASLVVYGKPAITRAISGVGTIESR